MDQRQQFIKSAALYNAVGTNNVTLIKKRIAGDADINSTINKWFKGNQTVLHWATQYGSVDPILVLVTKWAHWEAISFYAAASGWTPLHWAAQNDKEKAIEALAGCGANIEARSRNGQTALHIASRFTNLRAMRALIAAGADLDAVDNEGNTPLDCAERRYGGNKKGYVALLAEGARSFR